MYRPLSTEERQRILSRLMENEKPAYESKIPGISSSIFGKSTKLCAIYKIPFNYLVYNPHNSRFISQSKTREKEIGVKLDSNNLDHINIIEGFIWNDRLDRNETTLRSLIENGQQTPGVVTSEGMIVSGNRRFMLLNRIQRNLEQYKKQYPNANFEAIAHFEATIYDGKLNSEEQIIQLESSLQYGSDEKLDYNPLAKYLSAAEQYKKGVTIEAILKNFKSLAKTKATIKDWIAIKKLMDQYLKHIGHSGVYEDLYELNDNVKGRLNSREDHFVRLHGWLKKDKGRLKRIFQSVEHHNWDGQHQEMIDFKKYCFDYIRIYLPTQGLYGFRKLIEIFKNGDIWPETYERHQETMQQISRLESLDEIKQRYPARNLAQRTRIRNEQFKSLVEKDLWENLERAVDRHRIESSKDKPIQLLQEICNSIASVQKVIRLNKNHDEKQAAEIIDDSIEQLEDLKEELNLRVNIKEQNINSEIFKKLQSNNPPNKKMLRQQNKFQEKIGLSNEKHALDFEKRRCQQRGVNKKPMRISDHDVSAGYDIESYESIESEQSDRFIEVKTFSNNEFKMSANEFNKAKIKGDKYYIYLVKNHNEDPEIIRNPYHELQDPDKWIQESTGFKFRRKLDVRYMQDDTENFRI